MENSKLTIHHIIWYFFVFSILGLILETVFCLITTGVFESRKGLLLGPYCPIYGAGGVFMIWGLRNVKVKKFNLAIGGFIIGSFIEYTVSYVLEAMYGARFWDYSNSFLNINGRICLAFSIGWAIIAIVLIKYLKPIVDSKIIEQIKRYKRNLIEIGITIFIIIDVIITIWAINAYKNKKLNEQFDKIMFMTFPNIKIINENKE